MKRKRPAKLADLKTRVIDCLQSGNYLDTRHAFDRQGERSITRLEVLQVLKSGWHEKAKDRFDEHHNAWNYAVRGKTIDQRELRIIVSFDQNGLLIITAIDLTM